MASEPTLTIATLLLTVLLAAPIQADSIEEAFEPINRQPSPRDHPNFVCIHETNGECDFAVFARRLVRWRLQKCRQMHAIAGCKQWNDPECWRRVACPRIRGMASPEAILRGRDDTPTKETP
jgi:hypothetical protein